MAWNLFCFLPVKIFLNPLVTLFLKWSFRRAFHSLCQQTWLTELVLQDNEFYHRCFLLVGTLGSCPFQLKECENNSLEDFLSFLI